MRTAILGAAAAVRATLMLIWVAFVLLVFGGFGTGLYLILSAGGL